MPFPPRLEQAGQGSVGRIRRIAGWALLLCLAHAVINLAMAHDPARQGTEPAAVVLQVPVHIELLDADLRTHLSVDGKGVVLPSDGTVARFRLHFELPALNVNQSSWQLRVNRAPINQLRFQSGRWEPAEQSYYRPLPHDGLLPMAFTQMLPGEWNGRVSVDVTARSDQLATLRPQVMRMSLGDEQDKQDLALAVALYAATLVLALVAVSLFLGVRELAFLSFLCFMGASLLLMLTMNGHAYTIPWLSWMAPLGARGIHMAILLVSATGIAVVRDYAGKRPDNPWLRWLPSIGAILILCVAIACLMGFTPGGLASQRLVTACWAVATLLSLLAFVGAILRKAWLGVPLLLALLILGFLGSLYELSIRGMAAEFWGRFGYQIGLIFAGLVLVVALIGRVADFRIRHDRERNARLASESRLEQQEAYVELTQQLRKQLAHAAPKDIEWTAMQMSMARLLPLLQLSSATILLYRAGYDPILVTEPATQTSRITALTAGNATTLRSVAQRQMEVAALPLESNVGVSLKALHTYAGVPFVAKGGMGVALLERAGNRPFMADELALASRFAVLVQDITGEARTHERLRRAAELDVLTGILNRNAIDAALSRHFNAAFEQQQALAILFLDMDYFKSVNDSKGHACGDHCLQQLANTLRGALGPNDLLGRYGGEEFMVVLPAHDETLALQVADRLRARVESSQVQWHGQRVCLTVSVGVAVRLPQEQMPAAALERADRALYAAKHAGRNRVEMGR